MPKKKEKTLQEKLNLLNPDDYDDPKAKEDIKNWKDKSLKLAAQMDFKNHPVTCELANEAKKEIRRIKTQLFSQEDMPEIERKALFREKKTHEFYLALFVKDPIKELEAIDEMVSYELEGDQ
jgi:hypothetical protein